MTKDRVSMKTSLVTRQRTLNSDESSIQVIDPGWTERDFGNKKKCYKYIGQHRLDRAGQKCLDLRAAVPVSRSEPEQADLIATTEHFGLDRTGFNHV